MVDNKLFFHVHDELIPAFKEQLDENDLGFASRVYESGPEKYVTRLKAIGFDKKGVALDAGCGFGQWSACMSDLCGEVHAFDISNVRAEFTQRVLDLCKGKGFAKQGGTTSTSWGDGYFDYIFCYGALFCTPWKATLDEFARLLKSGGKLYFSANGLGYILNMWVNRPNRNKDFDPRVSAAKTFMNTVNYDSEGKAPLSGQILIDQNEAEEYLEEIGFGDILRGPEGTINVGDKSLSPESFFQAEYFGFTGCYEILATKK